MASEAPQNSRTTPASGELHNTLPEISKAWQCYHEGAFYKAASICQRILSTLPGHSQALHLLGLVFWRSGQSRAAIDCLERLIHLEPQQALHYNSYGVILNDCQDYIKAIECFTKALALQPAYHEARCNMGLSHYYLVTWPVPNDISNQS